MKPSLHLQIGHQLTMTPQLQQAIRLLQLSTCELSVEIQNALETNFMLELAPEYSPDALLTDSESSTVCYEDIRDEEEDVGAAWENWTKPTAAKMLEKPQQIEMDSLNGKEITLQDHLEWQMQLTPFSETDRFIALILIDAINEDGFLSYPFEDIVQTIKQSIDVDKSEVDAVLHRIQQFDPIAVGARNLEECLIIQLNHLPLSKRVKKAKELIEYHLPLLAKKDMATLKRRIKVNQDELQQIIALIQQLNPRPGNNIGQPKTEYIVPDVYTYVRNHEWQVELNPLCTPPLGINSQYAAMIKRNNNSRDKQFLRDQLQEARWFIKSIENRNETLLTVSRCIVKEQQHFLTHGDEMMKPLTLGQIAERVDMHESTISRVTTQKYIYTPRGIFELKYFFSSHINTESGIDCSSTAIRALIKKLVAHENRKKPLSDSKLAQVLQNQGIKVARRTIAKYRDSLTIPPSNQRKQLF